jgi:hypothetical protein
MKNRRAGQHHEPVRAGCARHAPEHAMPVATYVGFGLPAFCLMLALTAWSRQARSLPVTLTLFQAQLRNTGWVHACQPPLSSMRART